MLRCTYFSSTTFSLFRRHLIFIPPSLLWLKHCSWSSRWSLVDDSNTETQPRLERRSSASPRYFNELKRQHVSYATVTFASLWLMHTPALCSAAIWERQNFPVLSVNLKQRVCDWFYAEQQRPDCRCFSWSGCANSDFYKQKIFLHLLNVDQTPMSYAQFALDLQKVF